MKKYIALALSVVLIAFNLIGCVSEKSSANVYKHLEKEGMYDSSWKKIDEDKVGVSNELMKDGLHNVGLQVEYYFMDNGKICWVCIGNDEKDKSVQNVIVGTNLDYELGTCVKNIENEDGKMEKQHVNNYIVDKSKNSKIKFYRIEDDECKELSKSPFDWYK